MGKFKPEIEKINVDLIRLIEKYLPNNDDWVQATEARVAIYSCAINMDEVLEEASLAESNINHLMNDKTFHATPDKTVDSFEKLVEVFQRARVFPVVCEQAQIKIDLFKAIIRQITEALDHIERAQRTDSSM